MYERILKDIEFQPCTLVVVSKTQTNEAIMDIYNKGQRLFGENRVQELMEKKDALPEDIQWHLIGHLQTNKVKFIAPFIDMIQSVDSFKIWKEINKEANKNDRKIKVLLQIKIAEEESKYGFSYDELTALLNKGDHKNLRHCEIHGVMGMATFTDNLEQVRGEFKKLKSYFDALQEAYFKDNPNFKEISMGMSGDYKIAMEEGSTMIRVGSAIFD